MRRGPGAPAIRCRPALSPMERQPRARSGAPRSRSATLPRGRSATGAAVHEHGSVPAAAPDRGAGPRRGRARDPGPAQLADPHRPRPGRRRTARISMRNRRPLTGRGSSTRPPGPTSRTGVRRPSWVRRTRDGARDALPGRRQPQRGQASALPGVPGQPRRPAGPPGADPPARRAAVEGAPGAPPGHAVVAGGGGEAARPGEAGEAVEHARPASRLPARPTLRLGTGGRPVARPRARSAARSRPCRAGRAAAARGPARPAARAGRRSCARPAR